jgi:hypothetical protein
MSGQGRRIRAGTILRAAGGSLVLAVLSGCITGPSNPAATQPATAVDPGHADPAYWLKQPAVTSVQAPDYDRLWNAAAQTAQRYLFTLDRQDYRQGILTTLPLISEQWFEPWRRDVVTAEDLARSSLQTIRRTIHFQLVQDAAGQYVLTPKVLVEQFSTSGRRLTFVGNFRSASDPGAQIGSVEQDEGIALTAQYWYAIGRDRALENKLADSIRDRLR